MVWTLGRFPPNKKSLEQAAQAVEKTRGGALLLAACVGNPCREIGPSIYLCVFFYMNVQFSRHHLERDQLVAPGYNQKSELPKVMQWLEDLLLRL